MDGLTDSNGNLMCVSAAATAETIADVGRPGGGDGNPLTDENGYTDSNGNLMCKSY